MTEDKDKLTSIILPTLFQFKICLRILTAFSILFMKIKDNNCSSTN